MPLADLGSSFNAFFHAAAAFFEHLSDIHWTPFAIALGFLLAMQLCRAWAWRNVLRAAYPAKPISFLQLGAAYLAGAGINAIVPARAGDVTKVFLVKRQIPESSYPAVTSSFLVQTVFDTTVGVLVFLYAISQGLLPEPPQLPNLPAFEISFWADHPKTFLIVTGVLLAGDRGRRLLPGPPRAALLGAGATGPGHPHRTAPLPAPGGRLAGGRLALPLRRLLVLPRGLRDRRLVRQRDAGDERAGDRQRSSPSPPAARAPSRRCWSPPCAAPRAPPSSPSRSAPRSRWPPGRSCSASPRSCSSSARPTGEA